MPGDPSKFLPLCKERNLNPVFEDIGDDVSVDAENSLAHLTVRALVSSTSQLGGKTLKEVGFRTRYNASVITLQRHGDAFHSGHLGQIPDYE